MSLFKLFISNRRIYQESSSNLDTKLILAEVCETTIDRAIGTNTISYYKTTDNYCRCRRKIAAIIRMQRYNKSHSPSLIQDNLGFIMGNLVLSSLGHLPTTTLSLTNSNCWSAIFFTTTSIPTHYLKYLSS